MKLFVNYYVVKTKVVHSAMFTQSFWYSTHQLVRGLRPTNAVYPPSFVSTWDDYRKHFKKDAKFERKLTKGASQCITDVCVELATSYLNAVVETFETKLLGHLKYCLHNWIPVRIKKQTRNKYLTNHHCLLDAGQ